MPSPRLKFNGIQALLGQSLCCNAPSSMCSKGFNRILVTNKTFVDTANKKEIYRLCIEPHSTSKIYIWFKSKYINETGFFKQSFKTVRNVLKLLKSASINVRCPTEFALGASDLLKLIRLTSGKRRLELSFQSQVLNKVWQHVDELKCWANLLKLVKMHRDIPFDVLDVQIINNEELNAALIQQAKKLNLHVVCNFAVTNYNENQLPSNVTKYCKLKFIRVENHDQIFETVQKVCKVCPNMKQLEIVHRERLLYFNSANTFEELVDKIKQQSNLFFKTIQTARQLLPKSKINTKFCFYGDLIYFPIPQDWQAQLKNQHGFSNVVIEEKIKNEWNEVKIMLSIDDIKTSASFCYNFKYKSTNQ